MTNPQHEPDLITDPTTGDTVIRVGGVEIPYPFTAEDLHNAGLIDGGTVDLGTPLGGAS